ncbi:High-mobility group non-histone chromatin protein, partial [Blumeria graminis f. sp. tritici 96224]
MFFANEQRENVRLENPGITFGQVGKMLGERWKALSEKQRIPYTDMAMKDKTRYEEQMANYAVCRTPHIFCCGLSLLLISF